MPSSVSFAVKCISIILAFALGALIGYGAHTLYTNFYPPYLIASEPVSKDYKRSAFDSLSLKAESAIVYDTITGETLYAFNGDAQLPLASLTKMLTVYATNLVLHSDSKIVTKEDIPPTSYVAQGIPAGTQVSFSELAKLTLVSSSNEGAEELANASTQFVSRASLVASVAESVGLTATYSKNDSGLDENSESAGAYGSARDMALLVSKLAQTAPDIAKATTHNSYLMTDLSGKTYAGKNTNPYADETPGLLFSKTGYTDLAGGNLAVLLDSGVGHPVAIVVLGSTKEDRFTDVNTLVEATLSYFAN